MKRSISLILCVFIVILPISSCGYNQKQKAILKYVNEQMAGIADIENAVIDGYSSVIDDKYIDDWTLYEALSEYIIVDSKDLIEMAEDIIPDDPVLFEIHEKYLYAINEQHQAFIMILHALETQDYSVVAQANDRLDNARKGMRNYISELKNLMKKYNLELLE